MKKIPSENKKKSIGVCLSKETRIKCETKAKELGISVSSFIEMQLRKVL